MALSLVIAGRADSLKYAECERLCEIVAASFPSVALTKMLKHSTEWETYQHRVCCEYGFPQEPAEVLMWMKSGRFIGSNDQCIEFCKLRYKATLDLCSVDLERYMRENIRLACLAKDQIMARQLFCSPRALFIIDAQNDFASEGVIGVDAVDRVLPMINRIRKHIDWEVVALTQIQHCSDDVTFAARPETLEDNGAISLLFPAHCERGTFGAKLHPHLHRESNDMVLTRGENSATDTYRDFAASFMGSVLVDFFATLRAHKVQDVFVCGVDVSKTIKAAAILFRDARFKPYVLNDACCRVPRAGASTSCKPVALKPLSTSRKSAGSPVHVPDQTILEQINTGASTKPTLFASNISIRCEELPRKTKKCCSTSNHTYL